MVQHTMLSSKRISTRLLSSRSTSLLVDSRYRGVQARIRPIVGTSVDRLLLVPVTKDQHRQPHFVPPSSRCFSSGSKSSIEKKHQEIYTEEYAQRHSGIQVHPDSISKTILPGNFVLRESKSGETKKRYTELAYGYFWNIKDLKRSGDKPIMSNETLIPDNQAKMFPHLSQLESLSGVTVELPDYFLRKNRSKDVSAQCTLVAISFRDFGYKLLPSWLDPFEEKIGNNDRVEVIRLNLSEGWFNKWILRGVLRGLTKRNTPVEEHDSTLLYFGSDLELFRDALRMHNVLTGYVFLLDGLGRVRFAGSGPASEEEVERLVKFANDLIKSIRRLPRRKAIPSSKRRPARSNTAK